MGGGWWSDFSGVRSGELANTGLQLPHINLRKTVRLYATASICPTAGSQLAQIGSGIVHDLSFSARKNVADFCVIGLPQCRQICGGMPVSAFSHPSTTRVVVRSFLEPFFLMTPW
jgi:hypothetical protein